MTDRHLSTFNSKDLSKTQLIFKMGKTLSFILMWLFLIDIAINMIFPYPAQTGKKANKLQRYFEYGRSIEGKLNRMVEKSAAKSDPIIETGWLDPQKWQTLPTSPEKDTDLLVATYGMSFAFHISQELAEQNDDITLRMIGGPGAPPNHSFAAYVKDVEGKKADIAILGILASSITRMRSISGINWTYENPSPYTYPRYSVDREGNLISIEPNIYTQSQFQNAFLTKNNEWQKFKQLAKENDRVFNEFIFKSSFIDNSAIFRLIRRGWANSYIKDKAHDSLYLKNSGFVNDVPEIKALKSMLKEFANKARESGQAPIVLLINDRGYEDHLYQLLGDYLDNLDIKFVSTHNIASASDSRNFLSDGHFTPDANSKISKILNQKIRREIYPKTEHIGMK